jgi:DNA-binding NarL/FixJ family response regulator
MLSNTNRIDLSSRQRQILSHLAEGLTNREIALKLGLTISPLYSP